MFSAICVIGYRNEIGIDSGKKGGNMEAMSQLTEKYYDKASRNIKYEELHRDWHSPFEGPLSCGRCKELGAEFGRERVGICNCGQCQRKLAIGLIEDEVKECKPIKGSDFVEGLNEYAKGESVSSDWLAPPRGNETESNIVQDSKYGEVYDAINPPHYKRGPIVKVPVPHQDFTCTVGITLDHQLEAIEVFRHIKDPRLATAFKYIWRVAFGGKNDPNHGGNQESVNARDIGSAKWYLEDYLKNPPQVEKDSNSNE